GAELVLVGRGGHGPALRSEPAPPGPQAGSRRPRDPDRALRIVELPAFLDRGAMPLLSVALPRTERHAALRFLGLLLLSTTADWHLANLIKREPTRDGRSDGSS